MRSAAQHYLKSREKLLCPYTDRQARSAVWLSFSSPCEYANLSLVNTLTKLNKKMSL